MWESLHDYLQHEINNKSFSSLHAVLKDSNKNDGEINGWKIFLKNYETLPLISLHLKSPSTIF
jgi:hypothetical protein